MDIIYFLIGVMRWFRYKSFIEKFCGVCEKKIFKNCIMIIIDYKDIDLVIVYFLFIFGRF